ncbi:hypothetical protein BOX15_Mlig022656g3 [Macrostomum lignano]|uniref:Cadherin domain-containing protein n=1 Tax=Macrostomum lignano TaxID=282301 RepID=A0A267EN25_9PLAT|nr:hypothetical protein BOX15_Mlig022656g3 [Macrostomum lignano]
MPGAQLLLLLLLTAPSSLLSLQVAAAPPLCRFRVEEELPLGATIENSSLYTCLGLDPLPDDELTLTEPTRPDRGWEKLRQLLSVDAATGQLKVAGRLDRESPELHCPARQQPCLKNFQAQLRNFQARRMRSVELQLAIEDKNDNDPAFGTEGRIVEVKENSMGQRRPLPSVTDPDAGDNGRVQVHIIQSGPEQRGEPQDRLDRSGGQLALLLRDRLDFEVTRNYSLTLQACDRGLQPRCTTAELLVRVLDENDNAPKFDRAVYRFEAVPEDLYQLGQRRLVGKVAATDADDGENSRIVYDIIAEPGQSAAASAFEVDADSGKVYLVGPVNAAADANIELRIRATDCGEVSQWAETRVQIPIMDVNDHRPQVKLQFQAQSQGLVRPMLPEGTPAPHLVTYLEVSDGDLGDNGRVTCSLGAGPGSSHFALFPLPGSPSFYQVNATRVFDREQQAAASFEVVCRDRGLPTSLSSSTTVTVDIGDVNEWPPEFNQSTFTGNSVPENQAGAFAARVFAVDADATASLVYSISDEGDAKGCFVMDNRTGEIRTRRPLDRESPVFLPQRRPIFVITVRASDGLQAATARVEIEVTDVNDNPPLLVGSGLLYTNESFADSTIWDRTIDDLEYSDADSNENAMAEFSVLSTEPESDNVTFAVSSSGRLSVSGRLDREARSRYLLKVLLRDRGMPKMSSTATVTVSLMDLNDNAPVVEDPTFHQVIEVTDDHAPGMTIYSVRAHDADACQLDAADGTPRRLTGRDCHAAAGMSMRLSQRTRILEVNSATGELRVVNPLTPGLHAFNLTVTDRGSPRPLTTVVPFAVRVRRSESPFALGGGLGGASNWTLLLVVVVASSFLTLVLVVAIVLLNRRQPCDFRGGGDGRRGRRRRRDGYSGPKDQHCPEAAADAATAATPSGVAFQGDQRPDCIGPLTTFGHHGMLHPLQQHHMGTMSRETGNGGGSGSSGLHYPPGAPPNLFLPGDYEVASADSGHGASEEEMMHPDHRLAMPEHLRYVTLPPSGSSGYSHQHQLRSRSPNLHRNCNCIVEEDFVMNGSASSATTAGGCGREHHELVPMTLTSQHRQQQRHRQAASPSPSSGSQSAFNQPALMLLSEPQFSSAPLQQQQQQQHRTLSRPSSAASSRIPGATALAPQHQQHQRAHVGNLQLATKSADV